MAKIFDVSVLGLVQTVDRRSKVYQKQSYMCWGIDRFTPENI
jgi:hypothetical protein